MKNKLCLIVCENYKNEFRHILETNNMDEIVLETYPSACDLGEENQKVIERIISRNEHSCSHFDLFNGRCCTDLNTMDNRYKNLSIHKFEPCSNMLIDKGIIENYESKGAYLLTPGWLVNWRGFIDKWKLDEKKSHGFLKGLIKYFLLLDTGAYSNISICLNELSNYSEIPSKVLQIELDYLTVLIKNIILEWRLKTEHSKNEYGLPEGRKEYPKIIESLPSAVFIHADNKVVYANPSGLKLLGLTEPEQLIGKAVTNFVHHDFYDIVMEGMHDVQIDHSSAPLIEEKFIKADGTFIDVEVVSVPFLYNNRASSLLAVRDITKRKAMAEKLRQNEEQHKKLIEFLPEAVLVHDGNKILFCNKAAAMLLGERNIKKLLGKPMEEILVPGRAKNAVKRFNKILANREFSSYTNGKIISKNKTVTDVEINSTFIIYKGIPAIMDVLRDLETKKRMEELRRSVEESTKLLNEALEYDKLRSEFFSNISHEFRTPLNVILGTLQLINLYQKNNTLMNDPSRLTRYTNTMKQNCFRLLRLVNNLIDITKISSGFIKINLKNHDIVQAVEDITMSVAEYIQSKGLSIQFDTDVEEKIIACDSDKIERILLNLLSNAVKFSRPGGYIGVNIHDEGDNIIISVKDTGIGMPEDKLDSIFERFTQIDRSLTREHEGSGIGLSIVKSLVEMHNGSIAAKSQYGQGSEFIITLPAAVLPEEASVAEDIKPHTMEGYVERINIEFSDIYS